MTSNCAKYRTIYVSQDYIYFTITCKHSVNIFYMLTMNQLLFNIFATPNFPYLENIYMLFLFFALIAQNARLYMIYIV